MTAGATTSFSLMDAIWISAALSGFVGLAVGMCGSLIVAFGADLVDLARDIFSRRCRDCGRYTHANHQLDAVMAITQDAMTAIVNERPPERLGRVKELWQAHCQTLVLTFAILGLIFISAWAAVGVYVSCVNGQF